MEKSSTHMADSIGSINANMLLLQHSKIYKRQELHLPKKTSCICYDEFDVSRMAKLSNSYLFIQTGVC